MELATDQSHSLMNTLEASRVYYLDWMRVVAIYSVMFYHTLLGLNWAHLFRYIPGFMAKLIAFQAVALQIGMPMVFNISGRAQALSAPSSFISVARGRAKRLLLPFAVLYPVVIPPWQFIDLEYDYDNPGIWHMKMRFLPWLLSYWTEGGWSTYFDMAWLWFLPALYGITILSTPICLVAEQHQRLKNLVIAFALLLPLLVLLSVIGFTHWFIFYSFLGILGPLLVAQVVPLPLGTKTTNTRLVGALIAHNLIIIGSQMGIAQSFSYAAIDPRQGDASQNQRPSAHSPAAMIPMIVLATSIYIHGYFQHRWESGLQNLPLAWWTVLAKVIFLFSIVNVISMCTPMGDVEDSHYIYPVYSVSYSRGNFFGSLYVLGTFAYLALLTCFSMSHMNEIGSPEFHKHATKSTLVVYVIHWVFVKVTAFLIVRPALAKNGLLASVSKPWMGFAMALSTFVLVVICSLLFYALLISKFSMCGKLFGL